MFILKHIPEDFIVKEISDYSLDDTGHYSYFLLKKKNHSTLVAIEKIAQALHIEKKRVGYAGNKDKNAITEQVISIKNAKRGSEDIEINDLSLSYLGKGSEEIFIGKLKGNSFVITLRNLDGSDIEKLKREKIVMPNLFGSQRFSKNNAAIGKALIKQQFKDAVRLILETNSNVNSAMEEHLLKSPNDFVGALGKIDGKLLKLYVHAYQSLLFNRLLELIIEKEMDETLKIEELPLIGFGTILDNTELKKIIEQMMESEKITMRDFIIRQIPNLSSEGNVRKAFIPIYDFKLEKTEDDDFFDGKKKATVSFSLPKGAYATTLIEYLMK